MDFKRTPFISAILALVLTACSSQQSALELSPAASSPMSVGAKTISSYPAAINKACRNGRAKLYDECTDQVVLLKAAKVRAAAEKKVLLVSYGAEWCIWCHVFAKHIHGYTGTFEYTYGSEASDARQTSTLHERASRDIAAEAKALNEFVAENFVVVHIDDKFGPNGKQVLQDLDASKFNNGWIPLVFTIGKNSKAAASFSHNDVQVRRDTADWYRGYDRSKLLAELKRMHAAAK